MANTKTKIVVCLNDLLVGGAQRQFIELARAMNRDRFEIIFVTLFDFKDAPHLYNELPEWVEVHRLAFRGVFDVPGWIALCKILKKLRPRIVVSGLFFSNLICRTLRPFIGFVSIVSEQNTYTDKPWAQRVIDRFLALGTYRIVASSQSVADFTAKSEGIPAGKFIVIPNGVNTERIREELQALPSKEEIKKELGFLPHEKVIVNVARLMEQKNQELLIRSFNIFYTSHPDYRLAIVGHGPLEAELKLVTQELGLEDTVRFLGMRNPATPCYAAAEFFALSSRIEGFALVGIEAMACGLPVLSTRTAGPDEYVHDGENGYLVSDSTPEAFAKAMSQLVEQDLVSLGKKAKETAEQYSAHASARRYEALFEECTAP
jgi:glycosyltransferase involved in cell wall biosynthesis